MAVPFDIAADFLECCGEPGDPESPLTLVTVTRRVPDTLAVIETAVNVIALKRKRVGGTFATGGGGQASAETGIFRLWASGLSGLTAPLKALDRILDADGVTWSILSGNFEGFGGFVICECVKVRT